MKDGSLVVEVQDTGRGMSNKEQARVFEPYQRIERNGENSGGLGLGLALSKRLVELHNGQIWVRSRANKGTTIGFSLPFDSETVSEKAIEDKSVGKSWKLLIIEDDVEIVDSINLTFQMDWPEVALVSTRLGEEGIDLAESEQPDVIVLDLGLPDISGFEVLKQIRQFSTVPIIVLTVRTEEADLIRGLEYGADDYIKDEDTIVCGPLSLDASTYQLKYGARDISLTIIEGRIMQCLMKNAGHVITHSRLAEAVWYEDYPGALDSLRVYIGYLRNKIEKDPSNPRIIRTKTGVGYSLVKPEYE
jgi:two-component system KDP operon response regulator KdpE